MAGESENMETTPLVGGQATELLNTETALATSTESKVVKKIIRKKKRPARPQIDPDELQNQEPPPQTGTTYNIWYNKWSGGGTSNIPWPQITAEEWERENPG